MWCLMEHLQLLTYRSGVTSSSLVSCGHWPGAAPAGMNTASFSCGLFALLSLSNLTPGLLAPCHAHCLIAGVFWSLSASNTGFAYIRNITLEPPMLKAALQSCYGSGVNLPQQNQPPVSLLPSTGFGCSGFHQYTEEEQYGGPQDFNVTLRGVTTNGKVVQASRLIHLNPQPPMVQLAVYTYNCRISLEGMVTVAALQHLWHMWTLWAKEDTFLNADKPSFRSAAPTVLLRAACRYAGNV